MYARRSGDRVLTFDFARGLVRDNLLISDRETRSVWSQLHGGAIAGPLAGEPLRAVPALQTTWKHWRQLHPDTRVMVVEAEPGRPYLYSDRMPGEPRPDEPPAEHDASRLGLGLVLGGEAMFFPFRELDELAPGELPVEIRLGGREARVHYRPDALAAWAEGPGGDLLFSVLSYEHAWRDFHPGTRRFRAP